MNPVIARHFYASRRSGWTEARSPPADGLKSLKNKIDIERVLAHLGAIKLAYSVEELAEITPLSRFYWYQVINSGELEARKGGEKTLVLLWQLIEFLNGLPTYQTAPDKLKRSEKAAGLRARRRKAPQVLKSSG